MLHPDWLWAMGFFEGEGSFYFHTYKTREQKPLAAITIKNTDYDSMVRFVSIVGVGKINGPYKNGSHPAYKPYWEWKLYGKNAALWMELVYPYMSTRRKSKILEILEILQQESESLSTSDVDKSG